MSVLDNGTHMVKLVSGFGIRGIQCFVYTFQMFLQTVPLVQQDVLVKDREWAAFIIFLQAKTLPDLSEIWELSCHTYTS